MIASRLSGMPFGEVAGYSESLHSDESIQILEKAGVGIEFVDPLIKRLVDGGSLIARRQEPRQSKEELTFSQQLTVDFIVVIKVINMGEESTVAKFGVENDEIVPLHNGNPRYNNSKVVLEYNGRKIPIGLHEKDMEKAKSTFRN
jgi:hypothetical protein